MSKPKKVESSQRNIGVEKDEKPEFGQRRGVLCASVIGATGLGMLVLFGGACKRSHDSTRHQDASAEVSHDSTHASVVSPYNSIEEMVKTYKFLMEAEKSDDWADFITIGALRELEKINGTPLVLDLIGRLSSANPRIRSAAATALGQTKDARAVQPLIERLSDQDEKVRADSASALGSIGDRRAVEPLIEKLSEEGIVQANAANALGKIGDPRAIEPLFDNRNSPNFYSRLRILEALAKIGDVGTIPRLIKLFPNHEVAYCIGQFGASAVPALKEAFAGAAVPVKNDILLALGETRSAEAVGPLVDAFSDGNQDVREKAAEEIKKIGMPAVPALLAALGSENAEIRRLAASSFYGLGDCSLVDAPSINALIAHLEDQDGTVRVKAAMALSRIGYGYAFAVPALSKALEDADPRVRMFAATALGRVGERSALPALTRALEDPDDSVRKEAVIALVVFGDPSSVPKLMPRLRDSSTTVRAHVALALSRFGDVSAVPGLIDALEDREPIVRINAATALSVLGDRTSIRPLRRALNDESESVRHRAAVSLGLLGDKSSTPVLVDIIKTGDYTLYDQAIAILGTTKDPSAIEPLIAILREADSDITDRLSAAARALGAIGDRRAVQPLIEVLNNRNLVFWRPAATYALAAIQDLPSMQAILQADDSSNPCEQSSIAESIAAFGPSAIPAIFEALNDETTRYKAVIALGFITDPTAVPALLQALEDRHADTRAYAAHALGKIGDMSTIPALKKALDDSDESVRFHAAIALGRMKDPSAAGLLVETLRRNQMNSTIVLQTLVDLGPTGVSALIEMLGEDSSEMRWNAAHGLGMAGDPNALPALIRARDTDPDIFTRNECDNAIRYISIKSMHPGRNPEDFRLSSWDVEH